MKKIDRLNLGWLIGENHPQMPKLSFLPNPNPNPNPNP